MYYVYTHVYILANSTEQSPWKASQGPPHISWDPKVHYRVLRCPPLVPMLSQLNPVHNLLPISLSSMLILSSTYAWVFQTVSFLQVCSPNFVSIPLLPHICYMPCPSHSPLFDHIHVYTQKVYGYTHNFPLVCKLQYWLLIHSAYTLVLTSW